MVPLSRNRRWCSRVCSVSGVICSRTRIASQPSVLDVIEYVEGFGAEFEIFTLGHCEVLGQRHVEIRTPWVAKNILPASPNVRPVGCTNTSGL